MSALRAILGDRAPLAAAALMVLSAALFALPLPASPVVAVAKVAAGAFAVLLARDVLIHYGRLWRERVRGGGRAT